MVLTDSLRRSGGRMQVSVAVSTYNGLGYLRPQLDSILEQLKVGDQLVIRDDGSTDGTFVELEGYRERHPEMITLIKGSNVGYAESFRLASLECSGEIILFSDQDDIWSPRKVHALEMAFDAKPDVSVILHDMQIIGADGHADKGLTYRGAMVAGGAGMFYRPGCAMAVRANYLRKVQDYPSASGGHDDFIWYLATLEGKLLYVDDVLTQYRRHGQNLSSNQFLDPRHFFKKWRQHVSIGSLRRTLKTMEQRFAYLKEKMEDGTIVLKPSPEADLILMSLRYGLARASFVLGTPWDGEVLPAYRASDPRFYALKLLRDMFLKISIGALSRQAGPSAP